MEKLYSIRELIDEYDQKRAQLKHLSGIEDLSEATVRYYQQKGLFKPAGSSGKEARYAEDTLWRILFTRLVQLKSTQVVGTKLTLPAIERLINPGDDKKAEEMQKAIRRVALGEEEFTVGLLPDAEVSGGEWSSFSRHPDVELRVKRNLSRVQKKQLEKIAELVEVIIEG